MMKLLGTTTSPYVRKVRIVARAANLPLTMVDTRTEEGAALLARHAPLGKIPVLLDGDRVLPDSSVIVGWLWQRHEAALRAAGLDLDPGHLDQRELQVLAEGVLDAAINRFYLRRDNFEERGYLTRQTERIDTTLAHLDHGPTPAKFVRPLGLGGLSLAVALDWLVFRAQADLTKYPALTAFRTAWLADPLSAGSEPVV